MARTKRWHALAAQHVALARQLTQVGQELHTTVERLTATLQQAQAQLDALRSVRRWAEDVLAQGGASDDE